MVEWLVESYLVPSWRLNKSCLRWNLNGGPRHGCVVNDVRFETLTKLGITSINGKFGMYELEHSDDLIWPLALHRTLVSCSASNASLQRRIEGAPQLFSLRTALVLRVVTFSTHCVQGLECRGGGTFKSFCLSLCVFMCLSRHWWCFVWAFGVIEAVVFSFSFGWVKVKLTWDAALQDGSKPFVRSSEQTQCEDWRVRRFYLYQCIKHYKAL